METKGFIANLELNYKNIKDKSASEPTVSQFGPKALSIQRSGKRESGRCLGLLASPLGQGRVRAPKGWQLGFFNPNRPAVVAVYQGASRRSVLGARQSRDAPLRPIFEARGRTGLWPCRPRDAPPSPLSLHLFKSERSPPRRGRRRRNFRHWC